MRRDNRRDNRTRREDREREDKFTSLEAWVTRTELGKDVKSKKITEIGYASHSSIDVSDSGGVAINARYSKITLTGINGPVAVQNRHETITLENINGDLE